MARGVAYGTASDRHVLNSPAGQMSAFHSEPADFVRFCRAQGAGIERDTFVCRHVYGNYLERLLNDAAARPEAAALDLRDTEAIGIQPAKDGQEVSVELRDGTAVRADRVVLAVGNYPPQDPPLADERFFRQSRRYVPDPWRGDALDALHPGGPVLLMGTGLTMVDVVWSCTPARGRVASPSRVMVLCHGRMRELRMTQRVGSCCRISSTVRRPFAPASAPCAVRFATRPLAGSIGARRSDATPPRDAYC